MAKQLGHTNKRATAEVYNRDRLEAHRRVARARVAFRDKNGGECVQGACSNAHASTRSRA